MQYTDVSVRGQNTPIQYFGLKNRQTPNRYCSGWLLSVFLCNLVCKLNCFLQRHRQEVVSVRQIFKGTSFSCMREALLLVQGGNRSRNKTTVVFLAIGVVAYPKSQNRESPYLQRRREQRLIGKADECTIVTYCSAC